MEDLYHYLLLIFCIFVIIKFLHHHKQRKNLPPSPVAIPVLGHLHLLKDQPLCKAFEILSSKYGPILFLQLGSRPVLVVSHPSAIEECFTKNDVTFANRPKTMAGDHLTYNYKAMTFASHGHFWKSLRRITALEFFSPNSLQKSSAIREEEIRVLLRRLFKVSSAGVSQNLNLKFLFSLLTINCMMRMLIGKRLVEEEVADTDEEKQMYQEFKANFCPSASMNLCDFVPVLRLVGYKGIEKRMKNLHRIKDEWLQDLIDEIRLKKSGVLDKEEKSSLTETLLSLQESEPEFYSDDLIKAIVGTMLVAGTDTSMVTLEWAMSLLLNHPEALQKVRAEIDEKVGHQRLLNELDLVKLPYLRSVINEVLRLYPATPLLLPHLSSESCTVGEYNIPRGTMLMVNAWAMHRDPKFWEEPTEFRPERFEANLLGEREGFKYIPFGTGRRVCPGATMSLRIVSLALGALIQCFEWQKSGPQEMDMTETFGLTLSKTKPLDAVCNPRPCSFKLLHQI